MGEQSKNNLKKIERQKCYKNAGSEFRNFKQSDQRLENIGPEIQERKKHPSESKEKKKKSN